MSHQDPDGYSQRPGFGPHPGSNDETGGYEHPPRAWPQPQGDDADARADPFASPPDAGGYGAPEAQWGNAGSYGDPYAQWGDAGAYAGPFAQQPGNAAPYAQQSPGYYPPAGGPPPAGSYQHPYGYGYAPAQPVYVAQPSNNGLAIASMILGIIWIYWVGSILAVIFGHIAIKQIREKGQHGRGMAIAGLVLGYVGVGVLVIMVAVLVIGATLSAGGSAVGST